MTSSGAPISILVVQGSVRPGNYTAKAAALVVNELTQHSDVAVELIDPATLSLALPGNAPTPDAEELQAKAAKAAGVVLATPEYHGSFSSVMKSVVENLGFPSVLAGKPVALLGVAAGRDRCHQVVGAFAQRLLAHWRDRAAGPGLGPGRAEGV